LSATAHDIVSELDLSDASVAADAFSGAVTAAETHATTQEHAGPHVPGLQGHGVFGSEWITQTVFSTWIFMALMLAVLVALRLALRAKGGFIKGTGVAIVRTLDGFLSGALEDAAFARKAFFLLGGCFVYILAANLFGLGVDWLGAFWPAVHAWLRPINSDLNTTLGMAAVVLLTSHLLMLRHRGFFGYLKHYLFHFHGADFVEKTVNVAVGWLHLIGEAVRLLSLSLRLFGNIFAGTMLLVIMVYLTARLSALHVNFGELLTIPFWCLELFVAFIQALVFTTLACVYFREARDGHGHAAHPQSVSHS
jgi:F-type H+-transporting ATPase subunit a